MELCYYCSVPVLRKWPSQFIAICDGKQISEIRFSCKICREDISQYGLYVVWHVGPLPVVSITCTYMGPMPTVDIRDPRQKKNLSSIPEFKPKATYSKKHKLHIQPSQIQKEKEHSKQVKRGREAAEKELEVIFQIHDRDEPALSVSGFTCPYRHTFFHTPVVQRTVPRTILALLHSVKG